MADMTSIDSGSTLQQQADAWWLRLRSGEATQEDAIAFRTWCAQSPAHQEAWREVARVWEALDPAVARAAARTPLHGPDRAAGTWRGAAAAVLARPGRRAFLGGALTASAAALLAVRPPLDLWPSVTEFAADYRTGTGEQRTLALSEQVAVQMNTQTRINLRPAQSGEGIELVSGEAEIAARTLARPFAVYAGNGRILARTSQAGTRFNVRYTGPEVCVTCLEGSLEWESGTRAHRQSVTAGRQLVYGAHGPALPTVADAATVSAWRDGFLAFADTPLSEVIGEINRYRRGKVILRNATLGRREVRMRIALRQVDTALLMIRDLYGVQMTELPGGIVLLT